MLTLEVLAVAANLASLKRGQMPVSQQDVQVSLAWAHDPGAVWAVGVLFRWLLALSLVLDVAVRVVLKQASVTQFGMRHHKFDTQESIDLPDLRP